MYPPIRHEIHGMLPQLSTKSTKIMSHKPRETPYNPPIDFPLISNKNNSISHFRPAPGFEKTLRFKRKFDHPCAAVAAVPEDCWSRGVKSALEMEKESMSPAGRLSFSGKRTVALSLASLYTSGCVSSMWGRTTRWISRSLPLRSNLALIWPINPAISCIIIA